MTGKRFELCDDGNGKLIFNNISEGSPLDDNYLPQGYLTPRQVVDKLNTFHEENQALQEEIKDYNDALARLEEQNEQLKKEKYEELLEKNKQLKPDNKAQFLVKSCEKGRGYK